jgi:hypothetical protein
MNRSRAREGVRNLSAATKDIAKKLDGAPDAPMVGVMLAISNMAEAVRVLADVSEDQERELTELRELVGEA